MPTLKKLARQAALQNVEIAASSGLSVATISRMVNGKPVSEVSVNKVLNVLNGKLNTSYAISDIQGLSLTDEDE